MVVGDVLRSTMRHIVEYRTSNRYSVEPRLRTSTKYRYSPLEQCSKWALHCVTLKPSGEGGVVDADGLVLLVDEDGVRDFELEDDAQEITEGLGLGSSLAASSLEGAEAPDAVDSDSVSEGEGGDVGTDASLGASNADQLQEAGSPFCGAADCSGAVNCSEGGNGAGICTVNGDVNDGQRPR